MGKKEIQRQMDRFQRADEIANAALLLYGAIKASESRQPRFVLAAVAPLESAIARWAEINETDAMPESEETEAGAA